MKSKEYQLVFLLLVMCSPIYASTLTPTDWACRREIELSSSGSIFDYQVKIELNTASLVGAGKMRSDCADVRFTDSDKVTLFPFWLESGCNSDTTVFWVRVPRVSSGKRLFLYYGRPSAVSAVSGDDTFIFYDGFDANSLDSSKWDDSKCTSLSSGNAHLEASADVCVLESVDNVPGEGVIQVKARRGDGETGFGPGIYVVYPDYLSAFQSEAEYEEGKWELYLQKPNPTTFYGGSIDNDYHIFRYAYSNSGHLYYCYMDSSLLADDELFSTGPLTKIGFSAGSAFDGYDAADSYYDYVFIRKYWDTEPTASVKDEETLATTTTQPATTTSSSQATTTQAPTTSAASTTTTLAAYDICRDCCAIGEFSCSVVCGSSVHTINPSGRITDCSYDGAVVTIRSGSNLQQNNCINGRCASAVSTTTTTTTTKGSTTTYATTTLIPTTGISTTSAPATTLATTTLPTSTTAASSTTMPVTTSSAVSSTTNLPTSTTRAVSTTGQSTTTRITTTTKAPVTTTTGPDNDQEETTTSTQERTAPTLMDISTMPNDEETIPSDPSTTLGPEETTSTTIGTGQSWDLFDYVFPKTGGQENDTSAPSSAPDQTIPFLIVSFFLVLFLFLAGKKKKREEEKSRKNMDNTSLVSDKLRAGEDPGAVRKDVGDPGLEPGIMDEANKSIK
jgi:hypothetical protein